MEYQDYYKVLGVARDASAKDIKSAYRKLTKKYHPDVNKGDANAEAKYRQINEAYEVLGDADKRAKYDQFGSQWEKYQKMGGNPFGGSGGAQSINLEDLLRQFDEKCALRQMNETELWRQIDVARGYAVFDPKEDKGVDDVLRRADKRMYENKWTRKRQIKEENA